MPISATGNSCLDPWAPAYAGAPSRANNAREGGFTPVWRSAEHGFTLVELMVVLAIIGVFAAGVVMAIPDPRGRLTDEAEKFAARTVAARDLAIVEGRPVAVRVTARGYAFDRRQAGAWVPLADKPFRSQPWTEGTAARVGAGGTVRAAFDATGQPCEPVSVTLVRSGEQIRVSVSAAGGVRVGG